MTRSREVESNDPSNNFLVVVTARPVTQSTESDESDSTLGQDSYEPSMGSTRTTNNGLSSSPAHSEFIAEPPQRHSNRKRTLPNRFNPTNERSKRSKPNTTDTSDVLGQGNTPDMESVRNKSLGNTKASSDNVGKDNELPPTPRRAQDSIPGTIKDPKTPRETITHVREQRTEARAEARYLKRKLWDMKRAHEDEKMDWEKRFTEQEESFNEAQVAAFKLLRKGGVRAEIDEDVRNDFRRLKEPWRPFAKKYAKTLDEIDEEALNGACDIRKGPWPTITARGKQLLSSNPSAPSILLNTIIAHTICSYVIQDPFFGLKSGVSSSADSASLHWILDFAKDIDAAKMHTWRALTLQLLDPSESETFSENVLKKGGYLHDLREDCYERLATLIQSGRRAVLFKPLTKTEQAARHRELVDMGRSAGTLATRLWKQKTNIECFGFHGCFDIWNPDLEAHPSMLLEADDDFRNGDVVEHTVEPGIRAHGNNDGDNYSDSKIWSRCLVLAYEPERTATIAETTVPPVAKTRSQLADPVAKGEAEKKEFKMSGQPCETIHQGVDDEVGGRTNDKPTPPLSRGSKSEPKTLASGKATPAERPRNSARTDRISTVKGTSLAVRGDSTKGVRNLHETRYKNAQGSPAADRLQTEIQTAKSSPQQGTFSMAMKQIKESSKFPPLVEQPEAHTKQPKRDQRSSFADTDQVGKDGDQEVYIPYPEKMGDTALTNTAEDDHNSRVNLPHYP